MNIHGIESDSMLNGDGLRVVLWISGCEHHCHGCQNPQTWPADSGRPFTEDDWTLIKEELSKDYVSGITFSGGDPLYPGNRRAVTVLAKEIGKIFQNKTIWVYTGYKYEEVKDEPIMNYIDVLVDGEFIESLKDNTFPWRGSTNQRIYRKVNGEWKVDEC